MEKILITGARGFTAKYLSKALRKCGHKVVATSTISDFSSISSCYDEIVFCDLRDKKKLIDVIDNIKPDRIANLGGLSFVGHSNPVDFFDVNVLGTENLLSAVDETKNSVKAILVASSANVYGAPNISMIDENVLPSPVNHYAVSKLAMEHISRTFMPRLPITIVRPFNYIGYGQNENFLIPKVVKAFANCELELEIGNLDVSRDFSSIHDTVDAYVKLLFSSESSGETYNVCSGRATSLEAILSKMSEISGYEILVKVNPKFVRENEIKSLCGSNQKLLNEINWKPRYTIEETLEEIYKAYQGEKTI